MNKDELAARLQAIFVAELEEQLRALGADLLALEAEPGSAERLGSVFRIVHTLKGAAHAAHVPQVEEVCHVLESLLAQAREGRLALGPQEFSLFFAVADALAEAGARLRAGRGLKDSPLVELQLALRGAPPGQIRLPDGARAGRPAAANVAAAPPAPAAPPVVEPEGPSTPEAPSTPEVPVPPVAPPARPADPGAEQVRVEAEKLDALLATAGHLLVTTHRVSARPAELEGLHAFASGSCSAWLRTTRRLRRTSKRALIPASVLQALDELEQNLRRIVQDTGRIAAAVQEDARLLSQSSSELGERVRRLRLRPFSDACLALPRAVRDVATASGKEVRLEIVGGEVQADRAVLDVLHEVLLHLVRNAVDHGIEPPREREQAGKPRAGTVTVTAALSGQRLVVAVADDGAGLDLGAIRARLARQGVAAPEDEAELARVLFQPGFSTRSEVTAISGRGVGLDAVRTTVERIRGSVQVSWVEGRGTSFTLECPPTLATVRALLVRVGPQILAIASAQVEHLARVQPAEIRRAEGREVILTPEAPVPLVSLARLLGPPLRESPVNGPFPVVRLLVGGRRLAVAVDELLTEEEIVVRPLARVRTPVPNLSGAALLGTGQIALVLNGAAVVAGGLDRVAGSSLVGPGPAPSAPKRILVVDDSITTRTLEESILLAAGFEVLTAVDGADGWRRLQEQPCDLVVSDIEMPRMDGISLCRTIRGSERLAQLPVVLVSGLDSAEDRARGLEAGADAYLPKTSFDQQDLLDTIQQLLG